MPKREELGGFGDFACGCAALQRSSIMAPTSVIEFVGLFTASSRWAMTRGLDDS